MVKEVSFGGFVCVCVWFKALENKEDSADIAWATTSCIPPNYFMGEF